jgi:hypothetical protein
MNAFHFLLCVSSPGGGPTVCLFCPLRFLFCCAPRCEKSTVLSLHCINPNHDWSSCAIQLSGREGSERKERSKLGGNSKDREPTPGAPTPGNERKSSNKLDQKVD